MIHQNKPFKRFFERNGYLFSQELGFAFHYRRAGKHIENQIKSNRSPYFPNMRGKW